VARREPPRPPTRRYRRRQDRGRQRLARRRRPEATGLLGTYFASGDLDELRRLVEAAGLQIAASRTHLGTVKCPSVDAFVATEVESTPAEIPLEGHVIAARKAVQASRN